MQIIDLKPQGGRFVAPMQRKEAPRETLLALGGFFALFAAVAWRMHSSLGPDPANAPSVSSPSTARSLTSQPQDAKAIPRGDLTTEEESTIALFQRVSPAVVFITTVSTVRSFWSADAMEVPQGTGTGFIWDDGQHVVTNFHVVQAAISRGGQVRVTFDGESQDIPAKIIGAAPEHDLAVLELARKPERARSPIALGTSSDLLVGQRVYAIGNPFGLDQTLTTGIISGLGREIRSPSDHRIRDVIQTDAAINPGNSGGPLLDSAGRLIGINTAIVSPSGAYAGVGFAVPVDVARRAVPQLIAHGRVRRPLLGISMISDQMMSANRLLGVGIEGVEQGGPAARAGLRAPVELDNGSLLPDIILAVDGRQVRRQRDLVDHLDGRKEGDKVKLRVRRGSEEFDVVVPLAEIR